MARSKKVRIGRRVSDPSPPRAELAANMHDLGAMGAPALPCLQVLEPFGPDAYWIKALPGFTEAHQSANEALLDLFNRTEDARVGLGKHGAEFRWARSKFLVGQGFITETKAASDNGLPFPVTPNTYGEVATLGSDVKGKGTTQEILQVLHNAEKLTDPKPRLLRSLNVTRLPIVVFWVNRHLWLMSDKMISDWYFRFQLETASTDDPIRRGTVTRIVSELGLKKSPQLLVKQIISLCEVIFDRSVKG